MLFQNKTFEVDKSIDELEVHVEENQKGKIKAQLNEITTYGDLENWLKENKSDESKKEAVDYAMEVLKLEYENIRKRNEELNKITGMVRETAKVKSRINIILSIVFILGGGFFIFKFLNFDPSVISKIELDKVIDIFKIAPFWEFVVHLIYLIISFVLILFGVNNLKKNTFFQDFSGISKLQHEVRSGLGETLPLIQVIQETLINANKTFTQSLINSKALFWTGLVFISIALFQILVLGNVAYSEVEVIQPGAIAATGVTGGLGILSWIVSTFIAQKKSLQDNLDNITQLEFALVGFSKQLSLIDLYIGGDDKLDENRFFNSIKEVSDKTRSSIALIELYTNVLKDKDNEKDINLLYDEVRKVLDIK